jgi:hypothetical protein
MDTIVERALALSGAILIQADPGRFADPSYVAYEVGVQHPRQHRRFANFFRHGDTLAMYVKHDTAVITELYRRLPAALAPSEIAPKHWSKVRVDAEPRVAEELLATSYRLVCEAATRQGRALIAESAALPNRFAVFHTAAVELSRLENVHVKYNDHDEPSLSRGIQPIARFSRNRVSVSVPVPAGAPEHWDVLEPDRFREWPEAMRVAALGEHRR